MKQDLADLVPSAGMSPKDATRFTYKKKASDTSASLLQYYSEIPLEWIVNLGWMFRAVFAMFGYGFSEPLKSVYEKKRAFSGPSSPGKKKMRGSKYVFPSNCQMVLIFVLSVQCCQLCGLLGEVPYRTNPLQRNGHMTWGLFHSVFDSKSLS